MKKLIIFLAFSFASLMVEANWDGTVTGKIKNIDVVSTNGDNFGFRLALVDNPSLCGNNNTWAYINKSDDNYDAVVSVLLAAKMAEREVILYSNQASASYCHIGYVTLK